MIAEAEAWRAGLVFIRRHGTDATVAVAACADRLVENGDMAAAAACESVLVAIQRLEATAPAESERVH